MGREVVVSMTPKEFKKYQEEAGLTVAPAAPVKKKKKKKKKKKTPSPVESFGGGQSTGFFGSGRAPQGAGAALLGGYGGKQRTLRGRSLGPYERIVRSVGGFRALCPNIDLDSVVPPQGVTKSEFVLKKLGLTPEKEKRVAALMAGEGVLQKTNKAAYSLRTYSLGVTSDAYKLIMKSPAVTDEDKQRLRRAGIEAARTAAKAILFEEAGIACPINLEAIENPRKRSHPLRARPDGGQRDQLPAVQLRHVLPGQPCQEAEEPQASHDSQEALMPRRKSRKNPSAARAKAQRWAMPRNAGPYLPEMYPYGVGGVPASCACLLRGGQPRRSLQRRACHVRS
jgi:hypothetical protein